ncbi:MAG: putative photosynthetic complex assembly protein PuhE [Pseudomonadota bacterium]
MTNPWIAALLALFVWWFSTGAILWAVRHADRRGPRARYLCAFAALPVLMLGFWGFWATANDTSLVGSYGAFFAALAIWGWIELSFLTGTITGPNSFDCPAGLTAWPRFLRAWGTVAYHEVLLGVVLVALWALASGSAQEVGLWTFTILFLARISAKLNLFLGVPRINVEFLPDALAHLASHFRRSRLNWMFPASVSTLTFATALWVEQLVFAATPADAVGFALIAAITALALLEHWLMVLPLPDAKLWRWMLPAPKRPSQTARPEGPHGF